MIFIRNTVLFSCFLLLSLPLCFGAKNLTSLSYSCTNDLVYSVNRTSGRAYRNNLKTLLSDLSANASNLSGFYNTTVGTGGATVHGLFLCKADVTPGDCEACVANAAAEVFSICPNQTGAVTWYESCMLRYSNNQTIFSSLDYDGGWYICNEKNVSSETETALLDEVLKSNNLLNQVARRAAYVRGPGGKRFGVYGAKYSGGEMVYTMGQCYPGLSDGDCENCLTWAIYYTGSLDYCYNRRGGRTVYASCNFRFEMYPFYQAIAPPAQPPSPSPAPAQLLSTAPVPSISPPLTILSSPKIPDDGGISTKTIIAIVVPIIVVILAIVVVFYVARKATERKARDTIDDKAKGESIISTDHVEFRRYNFNEVEDFTSNFSSENVIGRGGFGPVYKGNFPNGQVVAMKRLSKTSKQGAGEFMNEITLVARLQHKNLVRLLGYCLERDERILIYEYVVNKSLDYFIFDPDKKPLLDWLTRYKIIEGVARGLLYLHEDSRLRIIHRDLKAGNVLLDNNMNPKIADFGLARLFKNDQCEGNTRKIAGTFGYMAPEYVIHGKLSVKSDVFSFGVLVLEIISGKRNNDFQCYGDDDLLNFAWKQWVNGTPLAVMDPDIGKSHLQRNEVIRIIHIGLLCVVENVERRPTMASVVLMLSSCSVSLPSPHAPAFFGRMKKSTCTSKISPAADSEKLLSTQPETSKNDVSITEIHPR